MSDQMIFRYQVVLMENPRLTIFPCEDLNPATLLPTPEGSLHFNSWLETLDHWTKPQEELSEDPLTNPEKSGTLMETALSWMEKEEPDIQQSPILRP